MKSRERLIAFFSGMLIAFGITAIDETDYSFSANITPYIAIIGGTILLIIFYINYKKDRRSRGNG